MAPPEHTSNDGFHHYCAHTQGQSNESPTVYPTEASRLPGRRVTDFIKILRGKEGVLLATYLFIYFIFSFYWSRSIWHFFFFSRDGDKCRHQRRETRRQQRDAILLSHLPHLGAAPASGAIKDAEWSRAVFIGSPSARLSVTASLSLLLSLSFSLGFGASFSRCSSHCCAY